MVFNFFYRSRRRKLYTEATKMRCRFWIWILYVVIEIIIYILSLLSFFFICSSFNQNPVSIYGREQSQLGWHQSHQQLNTTHSTRLRIKEKKIMIMRDKRPKFMYNHLNQKQEITYIYIFLKNSFQLKKYGKKSHQIKSLVITPWANKFICT